MGLQRFDEAHVNSSMKPGDAVTFDNCNPTLWVSPHLSDEMIVAKTNGELAIVISVLERAAAAGPAAWVCVIVSELNVVGWLPKHLLVSLETINRVVEANT